MTLHSGGSQQAKSVAGRCGHKLPKPRGALLRGRHVDVHWRKPLLHLAADDLCGSVSHYFASSSVHAMLLCCSCCQPLHPASGLRSSAVPPQSAAAQSIAVGVMRYIEVLIQSAGHHILFRLTLTLTLAQS